MVESSIRNSFDLDYEILEKQINTSQKLFEKLQIPQAIQTAVHNFNSKKAKQDVADIETYIKKLKNDYFNDQNSLFNRCNDQRKVLYF